MGCGFPSHYDTLQGRNTKSIARVRSRTVPDADLASGALNYTDKTLRREGFPNFQVAFACLQNSELHPRLRTAFARYLLHVYVSVSPHVPDMLVIDTNFVSVFS